jgi:hypothetical protein
MPKEDIQHNLIGNQNFKYVCMPSCLTVCLPVFMPACQQPSFLKTMDKLNLTGLRLSQGLGSRCGHVKYTMQLQSQQKQPNLKWKT